MSQTISPRDRPRGPQTRHAATFASGAWRRGTTAVAFYAIRVMTDTMASLHAQVRDDAETRRIVDEVLVDVLRGEYEGNHNIDVSWFKMTSRFQPLGEAVTT